MHGPESRPGRRTILGPVIAVVVLMAACGSSEPSAVVRDRRPASTEAPSTATVPDDSTYPEQPGDHAELSDWDTCDGGLECATLTVPRDWADVDGETIDLAVARAPTSGDRIGSLLLNPGGPGASGIEFVRAFVGGGLPDGLDERFDIVGWDPRGTGGSDPIDCTTDAEWLEPDIDPTPDEPADVEAIREQAANEAAACEAAHGDLLALVGTRATARDLEALRVALGDDGLSYVGYSYGTTIGMEYLRLYPDRVRAMVLDGVSVPGVDPVEDTHVQAQGFERTLGAYLDGCAERPSCPLGDDPLESLLDLVDRLEDERMPASYQLQGPGSAPRQGTLGVGEMYVAVAAALYDDSSWPVLDQGLAEALGPDPEGRTLLAMRDQYLGREPDGTWLDDVDARVAIRCADQAERSENPEGDLDLADQWSEELPFWGGWFGVGTPGCWGAPDAVDPLSPLAAGSITDAPPVVVLGATNDPATPFEQSEDAVEIIEGSVLVTFEGDVHTVYRSRSDCIDEPVTTYLIDLELPDEGIVC